MAESFDVLLNILLNRNAAQKTKEGIKEIDASIKGLGGKAGTRTGFAAISVELDKIDKSLDKIAAKRRQREQDEAKYIAMLRQESEILSKQAALAMRTSERLGRFGAVATVAGLAIGGGIIAEATAYARRMGDATEETRAFNAELAKIANARGRIDNVLTAQVLPLLRVASQVAEKTAGVIEKNPQLVDFALKGAALLVGIGTLAKLASTGFKIYADATFFAAQNIGLTAAQMQLAASRNQLLAAGKGGLGGIAPVAAGGRLGATLGTVALYATTIILAGAAALAIGNAFIDAMDKAGVKRFSGETDFTFGDVVTGAFMAMAAPAGMLANILEKIPGAIGDTAAAFGEFLGKFSTGLAQATGSSMILGAMEKLDPSLKNAASSTDKLSESLSAFGTAASLASAAQAYGNYVQANAASNAQYAQEKAAIEANATQQIQSIYRSHSAAMSSIGNQLASSLASIEANYEAQRIAAEQNYQAQRAQIIEQGAAQIEQIQRDAQERLRQLAQDHAERVEDLTNSRDALGLAQENRDYEQAREEETRRAKEEIRKAQEQTAQQLAELDRRYALEQQQAQAQYELQKQQAEAQAAEQYAQESANFQAQLLQAQEAKEAQLRDLEDKHRQELVQNRNNFIAQLRELGYYLNNDYNLQVEWHNRMLEETRRFLEEQNAMYVEQGGGNAPVHDYSGYAYRGLYRMAQDGQRQFVLSGSATRALESMVGGKLSQSSVMQQVRNGGSSVQIVDNKQYYRGISPRERKEIRQDMVETLSNVFAGV